jgi:hypothetical protein
MAGQITSTEAQLRSALSSQPQNVDAIMALIHTMFAPRIIRFAGTALTLRPEHGGAMILCTSASAVTVTLPAKGQGLGPGFLTTLVQFGAGAITYSGTHVGGTTTSAQNTLSSALVIDDGSWFVYGSVA